MTDTITKMVVEGINHKYGGGFNVGGVWYVADKKTLPNLATIEKGDVLEVVHNDKWVKEFKVLDKGASVPNTPSATVNKPTTHSNTDNVNNFRTPIQIIRSEAVAAINGSEWVASQVKELDIAEAATAVSDLIKRTTNYILTGNFNEQDSK